MEDCLHKLLKFNHNSRSRFVENCHFVFWASPEVTQMIVTASVQLPLRIKPYATVSGYQNSHRLVGFGIATDVTMNSCRLLRCNTVWQRFSDVSKECFPSVSKVKSSNQQDASIARTSIGLQGVTSQMGHSCYRPTLHCVVQL
jgi:hypothetical protein